MTPEEYIETAMKIAEKWTDWCMATPNRIDWKETRAELEQHLRENLDEIIEAAYDKGLDDRDED